MEEATLEQALAELYIGTHYAVVVQYPSSTPLFSAARPLSSVAGSGDTAIVLLGDENGPRLDIRRDEIQRIKCSPESGSVLFELNAVSACCCCRSRLARISGELRSEVPPGAASSSAWRRPASAAGSRATARAAAPTPFAIARMCSPPAAP